MVEWLQYLRFERVGDVLTVRRPRSIQLLGVGLVAFCLLFTYAAIDGPDAGVGPQAYAIGFTVLVTWSSIRVFSPVVVADRTGIVVRGMFSTMSITWVEIQAFTMNDSYSHFSMYPRLRIERTPKSSTGIRGSSVAWLVEGQVRELRQLAKALSHFAEEVGAGPRPWPERVQFEGHPV